MQKAALLLSVLALAVSGWLLWSATSSAPEVDRLRRDLDALSALEARVSALEGAPAAGPQAPRPVTVLGAAPPAAGDAAVVPATEGAATGVARPTTVPARVAELEKRLAALEDTRGEARSVRAIPRPALTGPRGGRVYMDVEDAKDDLGLTDQQKGDFERIVADARREREELRKVPDDEGKTWDQVQRETFTAEGGAFRFDMSKMEAFRRKMVPGRSETYGQAEQRIRDGARRRLRDTLTTAQQEKFDKSSTDPLLGGGGGAAFLTVGNISVGGVSEDAVEVGGTK